MSLSARCGHKLNSILWAFDDQGSRWKGLGLFTNNQGLRQSYLTKSRDLRDYRDTPDSVLDYLQFEKQHQRPGWGPLKSTQKVLQGFEARELLEGTRESKNLCKEGSLICQGMTFFYQKKQIEENSLNFQFCLNWMNCYFPKNIFQFELFQFDIDITIDIIENCYSVIPFFWAGVTL